MHISNASQFPYHPLDGEPSSTLWGSAAPDGDAAPEKDVEIGSLYVLQGTAKSELYAKVTDVPNNFDWACIGGVIQQVVSYADFTDGGAAAGTLALTPQLPAGAYVTGVTVANVTGFTGDTSAVLTVGDGSDVDRYNTGTPSVFATATYVSMGKVSGVPSHAAAQAVTLTVTSASDFTSVSAGALTIRIHYII